MGLTLVEGEFPSSVEAVAGMVRWLGMRETYSGRVLLMNKERILTRRREFVGRPFCAASFSV